MADATQTIRIFYSWQDSYSRETNRYFIQHALELAKVMIEREWEGAPAIRIYVDEATRDEPGSPNIIDTIFRKIGEADVFVCDASTINPDATVHERKAPNPNVMMELGYAVAQLGWKRIICLVNTAFSDMKLDAPFDIYPNRRSGYQMDPATLAADPKAKKAAIKKGEESLATDLAAYLRTIINANPKRPADEAVLSDEDLKRRRDVRSISRLLEQVNHGAMDYFLENAYSGYVTDSIFWYAEGVRGVCSSSSFHVYDPELDRLARAFCDAFHANLEFGYYMVKTNTDKHRFKNEFEFSGAADDVAMKKFAECTPQTEAAWRALLNYLRTQYVEIDLEALSKRAGEAYDRFHSRMDAGESSS